jgi:hypothetical protein
MTMKQGMATLRRIARVLPRLVCVAVVLATFWAGRQPNALALNERVEAPIIPTVHPVMVPTSAIPLPMKVYANEAATWVQEGDQRLFLRGHVVIDLAYRTLRANEAAIWLTPVTESGENAYDVAIFLNGGVRVEESDHLHATVQTGSELLVTSRILKEVQLSGTTPVSRIEKDNPVVARGETLRTELLTKPLAEVYLPNIVIQPTEEALQRGWIARGPGNRIISGPGDAVLTENGAKPVGVPLPPAAPKPKPSIFATGDRIEVKEINGERVTIIRGGFYLMYHPADGKAPYELRAQKAVLFSAGATTPNPNSNDPTATVAKAVTGAYLEGDVTAETGNSVIRSERLYFDFTSNRAIMLDAVLSSVEETRQVPVYMRAAEIRQLARGEYSARSAKFSTSEFYEPHYHIGASNTYLQDITPKDENGKDVGPMAYGFKANDATIDVRGVPIFYWPYLAGDTTMENIPLRRLRIGGSSTYGASIQTDWDIFGLAGQHEPKGVHADLNLDYFGKRGPAGGVGAKYDVEDALGFFKSYVMEDNGTDRLGRTREDVPVNNSVRGRVLERHQQQLDDKWTLQLEAAYVSDVNFLEQFFTDEFDTDKEQETSIYLKRQEGTEVFSLLGKFSLFDFVTNADMITDQYTTEKAPEAKYYRIGDSILDTFTYYSETGAANVMDMLSNATPNQSALPTGILQLQQNLNPTGGNASLTGDQTFRSYLKSLGWTDSSVLRGDTRQEIDLPIAIGDVKAVPYVTGRATAWDTAFPEGESGNTTRLWGAAGLRANTQFWRVYDDVNSEFFDIHRIRHIVEPEFNMFVVGSDKSRNDLQPFDEAMRDVEQISDSSAYMVALHQRWQTKRGGPGHWRDVDYLTLNVSYQQFWNKPSDNSSSPFAQINPLRGTYFVSRPDLSLVADSVAADMTWRVGEYMRVLGDMSYNTTQAELETIAGGVAVDQSPTITYFVGNRYVSPLNSNEVTGAVTYQLTRKYSLTAIESYDFNVEHNMISAVTLTRKLARFNAALTISYDANAADTTVVVAIWPEGLPQMGIGSTGMLNSPH